MIIDLNGWNSPTDPPNTDRVVLLVRCASVGVGILRDMGCYKGGVWESLLGDCLLHDVLAWDEYPELPKAKL